jgi:ferritin
MLTKTMNKELNTHFGRELYAWYLYLAMSAYFKEMGLNGFAGWMYKHAAEEMNHARKFHDYVHDHRCAVDFEALGKPKKDWESPLAAIKEAMKHEQYITNEIHKLVDLARAENDKATEVFLQYFVTEQIEEENIVDDLLQKLQRMGDFQPGLFFLDSSLASAAGK